MIASIVLVSRLLAPPPAGPAEPPAAPVAVPEAPAEDPPSEPVVAAGSVVVTVVGPVDATALATAIEGRLAPLGITSSVQTARDFAPGPVLAGGDRIAEIWVLAARSELRLVIAEPSHEHVVVRTIPIDEPIRAVSLEEAAVIVEEALVMARADAWPEPAALPAVAVAPPEPPAHVVTPAPAPAPVPAPAPRARGRFLRGLTLGMSSGVAVANDEYGERHLAVPGMMRLGWVFGKNPEVPDLRVSIAASMGTTELFEPRYDSLSLWQLMAESRLGVTRGPVWIYGIVGIGSGILKRSGASETTRVSGGALATLGAGVAVRLTHRLAAHVDGVASGNPVGVGRLGLDVGFAAYFDLPRGKGGQR